MNHDDAFIDAIVANPEDQGLRLMYADWLEERGDARGELLRLEATLATLPTKDRQWAGLMKRLHEVRAGIALDWLAQLDRRKSRAASTSASISSAPNAGSSWSGPTTR